MSCITYTITLDGAFVKERVEDVRAMSSAPGTLWMTSRAPRGRNTVGNGVSSMNFVPSIVAIVGATLSIFVFWRDFGDSRARRYNERFRALAEMAEVVRAQGPYAGPDAARGAAEAHDALLSTFDVERRAAAVLYLKAAGRLQRPGSMFVAFGLVAYAILLIVALVPGVLDVPLPTTDADAVIALVSKLTLLLVALGVFARGVIEAARRWESRQIRLALGHSDDLTRAAAKKYITAIKVLARDRARARAGADTEAPQSL